MRGDIVRFREVAGGVLLHGPQAAFPVRICNFCQHVFRGPHLCQKRPPYGAAGASNVDAPPEDADGLPGPDVDPVARDEA
jgi:hypothetical protein